MLGSKTSIFNGAKPIAAASAGGIARQLTATFYLFIHYEKHGLPPHEMVALK